MTAATKSVAVGEEDTRLRIKGAQRVEELQAAHDGGARRRIHEVKPQHVVDAQGLELQHRVAQVGALDFGRRGVLQRAEGGLGVEAEGLARRLTPCPRQDIDTALPAARKSPVGYIGSSRKATSPHLNPISVSKLFQI